MLGDVWSFGSLVAALPGKKGAIYTFERGKIAQHPHAALYRDVVRARDAMRAWGVARGHARRHLCAQFLSLAGA